MVVKLNILVVFIFWVISSFAFADESFRSTSNDHIEILDSALKTDDHGVKFIEVKLLFKKRATGRAYIDKPYNLLVQQRRYGKLPKKDKIFYFDSDYHFKLFVDLFGKNNTLIRTDSAYFDEYIPSLAYGESVEILPGEYKIFIFGVPKSVSSYKLWVTKD
jgi:hypothetical protein